MLSECTKKIEQMHHAVNNTNLDTVMNTSNDNITINGHNTNISDIDAKHAPMQIEGENNTNSVNEDKKENEEEQLQSYFKTLRLVYQQAKEQMQH
jgi:hypothetical protein